MRFSHFLPRTLALLATLLSTPVLPVVAQFKMQTPAGEAPGPWLFGTIGVGKGADGKTPKTTALKGLAIKVGEHGEAAVAYDLDLCRMAGAWTGGRFVTPMNLMSRGEYPTALGSVEWTTGEAPGFVTAPHPEEKRQRAQEAASIAEVSAGSLPTTAWRDPRPEPFGPLPNLHFRGLHVSGGKTALQWEVDGVEVLETPGFESRGGIACFTRTFRVAPSPNPLVIVACDVPQVRSDFLKLDGVAHFSKEPNAPIVERAGFVRWIVDEKTTVVTDAGAPDGAEWVEAHGQLRMVLPPRIAAVTVKVVIGTCGPGVDTLPPFTSEPALADVLALTKGGPTRWPETVTTAGELSPAAGEPYVVDTIALPDPNPWGAPVFIGGFDFFEDGRAALCTFHGDVFIASGVDEKFGAVTWRRIASGLYHALGLKIHKGEIYVTCRDGIYRLRDVNSDGEVDFYEVFNNDIAVTKSFHEFTFDLQTDGDGYFYFAKAGPVKNGGRGFDQIAEHHGCLLRVTPDGKKLEVMATGFRAPNGIGIGPHGEMTSGDNEGTWTPACKINWIKPGGFYGVVDLSHWVTPPTDYDRPLCWLPKRVDNSGGGQVWAPEGEKWGPWGGQLLHLSYGQCALFGVMKEEVLDPRLAGCCNSVMQGGVSPFAGLKFQSGIMRARFHPRDGQLYVAGLRGWQTTALKNGCFQRVRYTGAPVRMPTGIEAKKDGVLLRFACSLDTKSAADPQNWSVEVWNYLWSSAYGSPEISTISAGEKPVELGKDGAPQFSAAQMVQKGHDTLTVKSATIGTDDRSVFLEIPGIKPVMQMSIRYQIQAADGAAMKGEIVNTIHVLGE